MRAVARATGETLHEIRHRGFGLADPANVRFDPEPDQRHPRIVNWDQLDQHRLGLFPKSRRS
jgi:hypothetical protein